MYYEVWNETYNDVEEIPIRPCTLQDFGIDANNETKQQFFKADIGKVEEFKRKINILQCMTEPVNLVGNWNTESAKVLEFYFEKCDSEKRETCKSEEEVQEWMKDKYLILAYNRQLFMTDKFGEKRFKKNSYLDWLPVDIETNIMNRYNIQI
jgi:hypothetical protein